VKRFYEKVEAADGEILLDGRPVRTPLRAPLKLPNIALAEAVAEEWRAQRESIDPWTMPLTGLANAAIDRVSAEPTEYAASLSAYAENELLCYRANEPPELAARQEAVWGPILAWARQRYDVGFTLVAGIMHQPQPPETLKRLGNAILARDAFALAALSPLVTISGSLVIALALAEQALEPNAAFDAAQLDELWQAELWGEDDLATTARAARHSDFLAAARFLELLREPPA